MPRTCGCTKMPMANEMNGAQRLNIAACLGKELVEGGGAKIGGGVSMRGKLLNYYEEGVLAELIVLN